MANTINRVTILGNVGREPEVRYTGSGVAVCNLVVGTDAKWTDKASGEQKGRTSWHKVVAWGSLAELCGKIVKTGCKIYVDGSLIYEEYKAQDGSPRQKACIRADQLVVMGSNEAKGARLEGQDLSTATRRPPPDAAGQKPQWDETHSSGGSLDLPF